MITNNFCCCYDDDDDPEPSKPSVIFTLYGTPAFDVQRKEVVKLNFTANASSETKAALTNAKIVISFSNGLPDSTFLDTAVSANSGQKFEYQGIYTISEFAEADMLITATVTVTDASGEAASESMKMTVIDLTNMNIYKLRISAWEIDTGSMFSASTGKVYKTDVARQYAGLIDVVYYYSVNDVGTFAAPDDTVFDNGEDVHKWTIRKSTKLKMMSWGVTNEMRDKTWDVDVVDASAIRQKYATSSDTGDNSKVTGITDADGYLRSYVAFKTDDVDPIYGIIKVDTQHGQQPGNTLIDITVKVQRK